MGLPSSSSASKARPYPAAYQRDGPASRGCPRPRCEESRREGGPDRGLLELGLEPGARSLHPCRPAWRPFPAFPRFYPLMPSVSRGRPSRAVLRYRGAFPAWPVISAGPGRRERFLTCGWSARAIGYGPSRTWACTGCRSTMTGRRACNWHIHNGRAREIFDKYAKPRSADARGCGPRIRTPRSPTHPTAPLPEGLWESDLRGLPSSKAGPDRKKRL